MAKLGVSELRLSHNLAWMIKSAIWPRTPKFEPIAPLGACRQMGEISLSRGFLFFPFCDPKFCSRPKTKRKNRFLRCLIQRISIPGYCILRGIKLQKVSYFSHFTPKKTPREAFSSLTLEILKPACYRNYCRFQPNFAYLMTKTTKYSS